MFLVPVSMVFYKNKKYYLLIGITISSYSISTIFTYNLRYYIPVFILMAIIISISVFSIKDFKQKGVDLYICILCLVIIMLPNLTYWKGQFGKIGIYSSKDIYTGHYSQLLESINREDVSVLFVDTPYKSGFLGKTYSLDWYCDALITRFMDEEVSVYDFIRSFDYVLYRNDHLIHSENLAAYKKQVFPNTPGVKGGLSLYRQDSIYSLYKVKDEVKDEYIIEAEDSDEIVVNSEQVYFLHFESNFGEYIFEADVRKKELYSGYFTSGKLQINWMDSNGRLIDVCYRPLFVEENTNRVSVEHIITPDNAAYGGLYLRTDADDELIINGFILKGKNKSFVETVTEEYYAAVEEKSLIPNFG
jgi:hypothetical protein